MTHTAKDLSRCHENDKVIVERISGSGPFRKRLLEMGILKGELLHIVKYAPLKDPMEIVLKNFHLTLRVDEARKITVCHVSQTITSAAA